VKQSPLDFDGLQPGERIERNPLCIWNPHCGGRARIGVPVDRGGCINRTIYCLKCERRIGVRSETKRSREQ
jgi:hypothetical protein